MKTFWTVEPMIWKGNIARVFRLFNGNLDANGGRTPRTSALDVIFEFFLRQCTQGVPGYESSTVMPGRWPDVQIVYKDLWQGRFA